MPHIQVEHCNKTSQAIDIKQLNKDLHACLASQDTVSINSIKTRSTEVSNVLLGDQLDHLFIHINVSLLSGRSEELKKIMSEHLFAVVKKTLGEQACHLSVNVTELGAYTK